MSRRLLWQLYPAFLAVALGALAVVGIHAVRSISAIHRDSLRSDLEARAWMLARMVPEDAGDADALDLDALCRELGRRTQTRLTVIAADGLVLGDSSDDPARMDRHDRRAEVQEALAGRVGSSTRYSATVGEALLYVAVPIGLSEAPRGVARVALPLVAIRAQRAALRGRLLAGSATAAVLAALLAFALTRRLTRPIERMRRVAEQYAVGDLGAQMVVEGPEEVARLAEVLNRMGNDLRNRIEAVVEQRNEREAVLAAMTEGVLTVNADERIRDCNHAAARFLQTAPEAARGRLLPEVVRSSVLEDLVSRTLSRGEPGECDLVLRTPQDRFVQVRSAPLALKDEEGSAVGALVVMTDVTRLRRLETMRRDFVANVSHELKTPITSIRAACETLMDDGDSGDQNGRRFLTIIHRQAQRLEAIVEDLLRLSRIEHDTEREGIRREPTPLRPVLGMAMALCRDRAEAQQVRLDLACEETLLAPINAPLMEQAVSNLVDNAVKFSPPGGVVRLEGRAEGEHVLIRVEDKGPGIERPHRERIFERFYCVDPGRSRKLGGTGLGLAIVKHIALAHGGTVRVESEPGRGSTFILELPGRESDKA